jgi:hypothetical protein
MRKHGESAAGEDAAIELSVKRLADIKINRSIIEIEAQ